MDLLVLIFILKVKCNTYYVVYLSYNCIIMILFINAVLMATVLKIVKLLYNLYKNRHEKKERKLRSFFQYIYLRVDSLYYFLRIVYKRVPFSSVVTKFKCWIDSFYKGLEPCLVS